MNFHLKLLSLLYTFVILPDMCYRPLHIKNASRHFNAETMPFCFSAPCGKCEECRNARQSEWFVRSFYEWEFCKKHHGQGYFYTLTYNEDNLPRKYGIPCFSFEDIQLFIKRLKERLARKYGLSLSYLICCEYGPLHQRPHYHADFFLSGQIMPFSFRNLVDECWQKGFVQPGANCGVIDSPNALLYVTKYITKDLSFSDSSLDLNEQLIIDYTRLYHEFALAHPDVPQTFGDVCRNHVNLTHLNDVISFYNDYKRELAHCTPFVVNSLRLGYSMLSASSRLNMKDDTILIPYGKKWKPVPLPRYALRCLYYDRVPNERDGKLTRFVLSAKGKQHVLDTLDDKIRKDAQNLKDFFQTARLTDFQYQQLDTHFYFPNGNNDFRVFLDNLDIDYNKLAIYMRVYRNRFYTGKSFDYFNQYKDYLSHLFSQLENLIDVPLSEMTSKAVNYINNNMFNFKPEFYVYEQISMLYEQMTRLLKEERASYLARQRETQRKLRDIIKKSPLKLVV